MYLRLVSFCLDKVDEDKKRKEENDKDKKHETYEYTYFNFVLYSIYGTFFVFDSPFISFKNFNISFVSWKIIY